MLKIMPKNYDPYHVRVGHIPLPFKTSPLEKMVLLYVASKVLPDAPFECVEFRYYNTVNRHPCTLPDMGEAIGSKKRETVHAVYSLLKKGYLQRDYFDGIAIGSPALLALTPKCFDDAATW